LMLILGALPAAQVTLKDGRVLEGEIVASDTAQVRLKVRSGALTAVIYVARTDIVSMDAALSERGKRIQTLREQRQDPEQKKDAAKLWTITEAFKTLDEPLEAKETARAILVLDPDHLGARTLLGYQLYEGKWLLEHEVYAAKGYIFVENKWISREEADRLEAEREAAHKRELERKEATARARQAAAAAAAESVPSPLNGSLYIQTIPYPYPWPYAAWRHHRHYGCDDRSWFRFRAQGDGWRIEGGTQTPLPGIAPVDAKEEPQK
jgi:hypothetical protein